MAELFKSVLKRDVDGLRRKLAGGVEPDGVDKFGFGALHFAVLLGCEECWKELLEAGANPRLKTTAMASGLEESRLIRPKGSTFFLSDAMHGGLPEGAAFDKGTTPLHVAAWAGRIEAVEALIEAKAKPVQDGVGATPLHLAALRGHVEVVERLLEEKVAVDGATKVRKSLLFFDKGMTALHAGLESGNLAVVHALIAAGADPEAKTDTGCTGVFFAARGGSVEALNALDIPVDPGGEYLNWPIVEAVERGHAEMVSALLAAGAILEGRRGHQAPLRLATERNDLEIRQLLLDHGARPLEHSEPLWAAGSNDVTALREMAAKGVDINKPYDGRTPLMNAAAKGHVAAVEVLLELGADTDVVTSYSALHAAISNKNGEILDLLLDAGADCSVVDTYGNTPLTALLYPFGATPERVRRMIELGANPHVQNRGGGSSIETAREFGLSKIVAVMEATPVPEDADALAFRVRERSEVLEAADGSESWKELSNKLWDELVPPRNAAPTVQGEMLRCISTLTDEAYRNGNMNWGPRFVEMVDVLEALLLDGTFGEKREAELRPLIRGLKNYRRPDVSGDGSPYYLVNEAVVDWCLEHRQLIPTSNDN